MDRLTGWLIGAAVLSAFIFEHYINKKLRKKSRILKITNHDIRLKNLLMDVVFQTNTDRALILRLHNGGQKLHIGIDKYFSIIEEEHTDKVTAIKDDFQKIKTDSRYIEMISTLINEGVYTFDVDKMPPGLLKRRYELDGIKSGVIFPIMPTDYGFYYGSFSSTHDVNDFLGTKQWSLIELKINKIKTIYKDAKKHKILQ